MDFYDDIADSYAQLTGASTRREPAARFAAELSRRFAIKSAVDAACGAGLFTIELARLGVEVVGADISSGMLESAQSNLAASGVDADICSWIHVPMQDLVGPIDGDRDAVLCMGNSIPHLLADGDLNQTLAGFAGVLKTGGAAAIHLLNYGAVMSSGQRIVGITRQGAKEFIRFYDFKDDLIDFNILEIQWDGDRECSHRLLTTPLRPYRRDELVQALSTAGFETIEAFGDLQFNTFDPETSDTLLLVATKSA